MIDNTQPKLKYRHDYQPPNYTIRDLELRFELDPKTTIVTATTQIKRLAKQVIDLTLMGEGLTLISISVNDRPWLHYQLFNDHLVLSQLPEKCTLTIVNQLQPEKNTELTGLYVSGDALCTQCEAEGFHHITYYLDRPDVLATFKTRIIANKVSYPYLLSNGNLVAKGEYNDGRHWVEWQDPYPKPCYLFALVAGNFDVLRDHFITKSGRKVALELFVDLGRLDRADWAMKSLKKAIRWDETRFGLEYDLDIYMIVAVDFFNMGAMENKGLNIFNAKYVLAKKETATDQDYLNIESVIGHEYFHNWTGNRITCRDWFQLSLKEGLTVFRDQEFSSDLGSRSVNRINAVRLLRSAQFAEDSGPMSHPIRPEKMMVIDNFYTLTVYEKGAEVIRMLHTLLGEDKFQSGMRLYIQRYDGGAATCDDFIQAMQDASKLDLSLFRRWYSQSGTPKLTISDHYDLDSKSYRLTIKQMTDPTHDQSEKQPLHIPLNIELYASNGDTIPLQYQNKRVNQILNVIEAEQLFIFEGVHEKPIISLLGDFSAPVKLDYPYSNEQLYFLIQYANNDVARWDAAQILIMNYVKINVKAHQQGAEIALPGQVIDAFKSVLLTESLDPDLVALILTLPSETEMAGQFEIIDPDAIHIVREKFIRIFATEMNDELLAIYFYNELVEYKITQQDIAKRSLRNVCLSYLAFTDYKLANKLIKRQYYSANNMTDVLAALSAAVNAQLASSDLLLKDFDNRWDQDGLVMDKWFTLQATNPTETSLALVKSLYHHQTFSLSNPNRVRSLIGAFVTANPYGFHTKGGEGYHFLAEILTDLNERNPQLAAHLIEPLIQLKRYDPDRQLLMRLALQKLSNLNNFSVNLIEKITEALS